jgi:anti-anti-sigma factor
VGSAPNFRIDALESQSGLTIKLAGELDSATSMRLLEHFDRALEALDGRELVIDLDEISFIDSSGMRALILIERRAEEERIAVAIARPPSAVTELLQITGIADRVPLTPRTDDAPPAADQTPAEPFLERVELALTRDVHAPARARGELRQAILGRLSDRDCATATLVTSELVTNAVIHPAQGIGGSVGLRITAYPDRIRVEVTDEGSGFDPRGLRPRALREAGGHGLVVVDGLASRWGTTRCVIGDAEGFCVWFELDADPERTGAAKAQFSTPSRSQQYSSRHSLASSMHRASDSQGSTVSNA